MTNNIKLSIITVVYNDKSNIEETIRSVIYQTYTNIEYIIIDGGSTDGTIDIIKKYKDKIDYFISEKDNGIYDAMNKGIRIATGNYINFMNSGDRFNSLDILKLITDQIDSTDDVIYGNHIVYYDPQIYGDFQRTVIASKNLDNIWKGMPFSHQSCFVKTEIMKNIGFNYSNLKIAQDFALIYELYKKKYNFKFVDLTISSILAGGYSDTFSNRYHSLKENLIVLLQNNEIKYKIIRYVIIIIIIELLITFIQILVSINIQKYFIQKLKGK